MLGPVAGDRSRATNSVYGSAKAGFTALLSGLLNRLEKRGVHVVTVHPGFLATQVTEGMNPPAQLTAEPSEVAEAIACAKKQLKYVIYVQQSPFHFKQWGGVNKKKDGRTLDGRTWDELPSQAVT